MSEASPNEALQPTALPRGGLSADVRQLLIFALVTGYVENTNCGTPWGTIFDVSCNQCED